MNGGGGGGGVLGGGGLIGMDSAGTPFCSCCDVWECDAWLCMQEDVGLRLHATRKT
jgi:hypothetical protein